MVSKKKKDGKPKKLKAGADSDSFKPEGSELNTEETVPAAPSGETCTSIDSAKVRRRRGAVGMEKVLMKKAKGQKTDVKYNDKGTPSRDDRTTLQSYIGMIVRKTVPINILDWRDVSKEDKAMVWKDITDTFNVAPESEKDLMISAGAKWRQFKIELFTKHVLPYLGKKKKLRKPPKMYDFVGLQAWKEFVKLRSTPQWLELHEKQSGRVKNRKCHHRTSRKGYIGLEEDLRQSWPEGEVIDRAVLWKKARLLPDGKMDEEAAVVATKIMLLSFKQQGAHLIEGSFSDHQSLVDAVKQVDVVICAMSGVPFRSHNILLQLKLVDAIKEAGNIQFIPSEFGMDPARMRHALAPGRITFDEKLTVRKAIEDAGIPFTYISCNCFAGYSIGNLGQMANLIPPRDKVCIYGDGNVKAAFMDEDDIATYTIMTVDDPRTVNKTIYTRAPDNILSQRDLITVWETLIGKELEKSTMSADEFLASMKGMDYAGQVGACHYYHIFFEGCLTNFEIGEEEEASRLYPEVKYTRMSEYHKRYL